MFVAFGHRVVEGRSLLHFSVLDIGPAFFDEELDGFKVTCIDGMEKRSLVENIADVEVDVFLLAQKLEHLVILKVDCVNRCSFVFIIGVDGVDGAWLLLQDLPAARDVHSFDRLDELLRRAKRVESGHNAGLFFI